LIGNPTNVNHLAEGILDAVEKQLIGTINISGNTWLSRYEIAKEIGRYLVKTDKIKSYQVSDSPAWGEARRPEKAGFRLDRAIAEKVAVFGEIGLAGGIPAGVTEIEFFVDHADSRVVLEVMQKPNTIGIREFAGELQNRITNIQGVSIFSEAPSGGAAPPEFKESVGNPSLLYQVGEKAFRVTAGSFFQTNRHLVDELVRIVTESQSGDLALDLYAGVGLFSTALGSDMRHIVSIEASQTSSDDLAYNRSSNGEVVLASTEQYLARAEVKGRVGKGEVLTHTLHTPDLAVVDPPRSGLGERVARALVTLGAPRVIYVSCDPVTLARDLITLLGSGYRIDEMHLVDLFPQTFHLETVVHLVR